MASNIPAETWKSLQDRVTDAVKTYFPFEGRTKKLVLNNIQFDENQVRRDDIRSQETAKSQKKTWGAPVYADVSLVDKVTGKEIDRSKVKLLTLPKPTNRYSYIVDGSEWQVDNLWRLRAGVYAHVKQNGEHETEFNLAKPFAGNPRIKLPFDPESRKFNFQWGTYKPPLYPILKLLGVQDEDMKKVWGEDIYKANVTKDPTKDVEELYNKISKNSRALSGATTYDQKASAVVSEFMKTKLLPETTQLVFGKPFDHVNGEALLLGSKRILGVSRGDIAPDDRNSLVFKTLHGTDDFIHERLAGRKMQKNITGKLQNNIDRQVKVRDIISGDLFNRPVKEFFTSSMLSRNPEQVNPLEMISNHRSTTIMGDEGGIKNEQSVTPDMKLINPSHFGFLDPIHTPESERTGITLHLPIGVTKKGNTPIMTVYDLKQHKLVSVSPSELHAENVLLPDQVTWKGARPHPIADSVKMKDPLSHEVVSKPFDKAKYLVVQSHQLFDEATNLIPFLQNNQGNRTMTASRQGTQAVSLYQREQPLVQVQAGGTRTWESLTGFDWSHRSPVDGKVVDTSHSKENGHLESYTVQDAAGKKHEVQVYNHFPLNDSKTFIHSTPIAKVGDEVKKGQILADTNFTKDGSLSLGTNLRVAYLPYKGYNFEDGIVISDSAAKKLTSEHLHRKTLEADPEKDEISKSKFIAYAGTTAKKLTNEQMNKIGTNGVVQVGQKVNPGDILIAAVGKKEFTGETSRMMSRLSKKAFNLQDKSVTWDSDHPGEVVKVTHAPNGKGATVYVKTLEPAEIGDKIVGRHGNKAIITRILPDHEMPRMGSTEGEHVQVLMNPSGVPTRINLGQMLETAASKIAKKTGKPYIVNNFAGPDVDYSDKVKKDLKANNLSDQEELWDPNTGKRLGNVLTGNQYIFKLKHQVEKKLAVRGGGQGSYTIDHAPKGTGASHPGQGLGQLEFYAMLAHGARANLREMATYKSDQHLGDNMDPMNHVDFWDRVRTGQPLPAPKPTFAYKKFEALLTGLGVNIHKEGHELQLMPLTDKGVLAMSHGEIKDGGRVLRGKDAKELEKGLFDPKITGGLPNDKGKGLFWSHISLAEPVPNPTFVGSGRNNPGPAVTLSDLTFDEFEAVAKGRKSINGKTGGHAINDILKNLDVKKELKSTLERLPKLKGPELNRANNKAKYLIMLDKLGLKANEAYMMNHLPVLPPAFRPIVPMPDGSLRFDDVNQYYRSIALLNDRLKNPIKELGGAAERNVREQLYDAMRAYAGLGGQPVYESNRQMKGILDVVSNVSGGSSPKEGFFQKKLMKRRQELSMRSTIIPDPTMHLDHVGLPKEAAMELYKPFVVRELGQIGLNQVVALKAIKEGKDIAWKALDKAMDKRPVLLKRDPALHKFSIMAFKPKAVEGKAIQIHPLVTAGYNADFDGDTMSAFVPLADAAVQEAHKMFPSNNLFSSTHGGVMYEPTQEALLGLHLMTKWGNDSKKAFPNFSEAVKAHEKGVIGMTDVIKVGGKQTTLGRMSIINTLPDEFKKNDELLHDPKYMLRKKNVKQLLGDIARKDPKSFSLAVDHLKDLGNDYSYSSGFSFGLKDLDVQKELRDSILKKYDIEAKAAQAGKGSQADKDQKQVEIYSRATDDLVKQMLPHLEKSDNKIYTMVYSGARGSVPQFRQIAMAPMLMKDGAGRTIPTPVKKSYAEGLDIGDYWTTLHGARMGTLQKVEGTSEPGALTKDIANVMMPNLIVSHDCGTKSGIAMDVTDDDVHDRVLAKPVKLGKHTVPEGEIITPELTSAMIRHKVDKVVVRSPLKCSHGQGICAKCYGLNENGNFHEIGTNIGIISGHSMGEPATQLAMDSFHCNHADSLIFVRNGESTLTISMEAFFDLVETPPSFEDDEEIKHVEGWEIYDGNEKSGWTTLTHIRRHAPHSPMVLVGDGGLATICQDNHPIAVWQNLVRCTQCGYHRLKASSSASRSKKHSCPECGLYQEKPEIEIGSGGFLQPREMEEGKLFLHRDMGPALLMSSTVVAPPEFPPYFVGMFLAEGCVLHRHAYKHVGEKKPYTTTISQNDGPIKDKLINEYMPVGYKFTVNSRAIVIHGLDLGTRLTELFGRYSHSKALPPTFMSYPQQWLADFICGVIDGDGTIKRLEDGPDQICVDTNSFEMAQQLILISARLGISAGMVATKLVKLSRHQGYRVGIRMTKRAVEILHTSYKVAKIEKLSPDQEPEVTGYRLLRKVRSVLYTKPFVYDATTTTGVLYVSGLKSHNTGGVAASRGAGAVDKFTRLNQLLNIPKTLMHSASLSTADGAVQKVELDKATNGHYIHVGGQKHYAPAGLKVIVKQGETVNKGDALTEGPINPHELLPLTDIHTVQNYLTNELYSKIYKDEHVRRRNIETVVRALTNLSKVHDPGDSDHLHGDTVLRTVIDEHNRNLHPGELPIIAKPIIKGAEQVALDQHEDWMARLNYQRLKNTILEGAAKGWKTDIHGSNPVPAYAFGAEFGKGTPDKPHNY